MESLCYPNKDLEVMSFARNYHRWIFDLIQPHLGAHVVEVGAGIGNFSQFLLEALPLKRLYAFEPSSNLFPTLKQQLDKDDRTVAENQYFSIATLPEPVDTVLYINVLEHIEDHAQELLHAYDSLQPNGKLIIFVPALPWLYSALDRQVGHVRRYKRPALIKLVESAGFKCVHARHFDIAGILPWYIYCTLLGNTLSSGNTSLYDQWVVPVMRRAEGICPPPIGKNILLIAQK